MVSPVTSRGHEDGRRKYGGFGLQVHEEVLEQEEQSSEQCWFGVRL